MYPGNHVESGIVTVPTKLRTRKNAPTTHLAYITDKEAGILKKLKKGVPHKGPHGIPNYDSFDFDRGDYGTYTSSEQHDVGDTRQDTSYSTRDVRSSPDQREKFRYKEVPSGPAGQSTMVQRSKVITPSERIARIKAALGRDTLHKPLFVTGDLSYDELDEIATEGERLLDLYGTGEDRPYQSGWEDWTSFFDPLKGLEDITGPTSKLWYQDEGAVDTGGPGGPGSWAAGYGGDYGDAAYFASLAQGPKQRGEGEFIPQGLEMLDYMVRLHKENPYTNLAMARDGGIIDLVK